MNSLIECAKIIGLVFMAAVFVSMIIGPIVHKMIEKTPRYGVPSYIKFANEHNKEWFIQNTDSKILLVEGSTVHYRRRL